VNKNISNKYKMTGQADEVVWRGKSALLSVLSCSTSIVNLTFFSAGYFLQEHFESKYSESILLALLLLFCVNIAYVSYSLVVKIKKSTSIFVAAVVTCSMILSMIVIVVTPLAMLQVFFLTLR